MAKKKVKKATAKKKTAKKSTKSPASRDVLVVASKCKNYVKSKGFMCSADAIQAMSERIYDMLDKAMVRTEANRRTTVKPQDL